MKKQMKWGKNNFPKGSLELMSLVLDNKTEMDLFFKSKTLSEIVPKHEPELNKIIKSVSKTPLSIKRDALLEHLSSLSAEVLNEGVEILSNQFLIPDEINWSELTNDAQINVFMKMIFFKAQNIFEDMKAIEEGVYESFWESKHRNQLDDSIFFFGLYLFQMALSKNKNLIEKNNQDLLICHMKLYFERAESHFMEKMLNHQLLEKTDLIKDLVKKNSGMEKKLLDRKKDEVLKNNERETFKSRVKILEKEMEALKKNSVKKERLLILEKEVIKLREENSDLLKESDVLFSLPKYLAKEGLNEALKAILKPYLEVEEAVEVKVIASKNQEPILGFCKIENGKHMCYDAQKMAYEVKGLPNDVYLCDKQMLKITYDGQFIEAFEQKLTSEKRLLKGANFVSQGNQLYLEIFGEKMPDAIEETQCFVASSYLESATIRNQSVYTIIEIIETGFLAIDVLTKNKVFVQDLLPKAVKPYHVVFMHKHEVVKHMAHMRFLTKSETYADLIPGVVSIENGTLYIRCTVSGELRQIKNIPSYANLGQEDAIFVDPYMNFVKMDVSRYVGLNDLEKKELIKKKDEPSPREEKEKEAPIEFRPEKILIIGNKKYANAYVTKMALHGFKVVVADGHEKWNNLAKAIHANEIIVYITEHTSHTHTNKYKKEFSHKETILVADQGANRVVDAVLNYFAKNKAA